LHPQLLPATSCIMNSNAAAAQLAKFYFDARQQNNDFIPSFCLTKLPV
jgi:hypothetical protein